MKVAWCFDHIRTYIYLPHAKRSSAEHRGANSMGVKHLNQLHFDM